MSHSKLQMINVWCGFADGRRLSAFSSLGDNDGCQKFGFYNRIERSRTFPARWEISDYAALVRVHLWAFPNLLIWPRNNWKIFEIARSCNLLYFGCGYLESKLESGLLTMKKKFELDYYQQFCVTCKIWGLCVLKVQ